jgi:hypothetical protein
MKYILISGLLFSLLTISCANGTNKSKKESDIVQINVDTLIGNKEITNEIAGAAFRKRAESYFLVIKRDTSDFQPVFAEFNEGNKVGISLSFFKGTLSYRQRLIELKKILPVAAKKFNLDSLRSITLGRLILSGDLAIEITKQYRDKFGQNDQIVNYEKVLQFLLESKLTTDLDDILKPYSISVDKIDAEHIFFTTKQDLYLSSKIESDPLLVPDKIFDSMIWLRLRRTK